MRAWSVIRKRIENVGKLDSQPEGWRIATQIATRGAKIAMESAESLNGISFPGPSCYTAVVRCYRR